MDPLRLIVATTSALFFVMTVLVQAKVAKHI